MSSLLQTIKIAALDAVNASKPIEIIPGEVLSISPLKINLEQKLTLTEAFVIVPREFKNYTLKIMIDNEEKEIEIKNALEVGEKIMLAKIQGGQKYLILARLVKNNGA